MGAGGYPQPHPLQPLSSSDPTSIWNELLFGHPVFKFIVIRPCKPLLLGDVDLLAARELELGRAGCLSHMFFVLQPGVDGH